jgi:hypothetical protein
MKRLILFLFFLLFITTAAWAESSVWKAEKGDSVIYLGGTLHILRDGDFPLPAEFDAAYRAADLVILETEIDRLQDPAVQQRLLARAMYADGSTIDRHLSPKVYGELQAYCDAAGFPLQAFRQFKPSMLMATLTVMELMKLGVSRQGVDHFFFDLARRDGKEVRGLETVDEQIDALATMADGAEDAFVRHSLDEMKTIRQQFDTLSEAWRSGDAERLDALMVSRVKKEQPAVYRRLITERNSRWLGAITAPRKGRGALVLVGMAHLVGPDGLIAGLRKKGYTVRKL